MNSRGIESALTAYFVVVLIVASVILITQINMLGTLQEAKLSKNWDLLRTRRIIQSNVMNCLNPFGTVSFKNIAAKLSKCKPNEAKGIAIEKLSHMNCKHEFAKLGDINNCKYLFVFPINIQEQAGKICMGKLFLCFEKFPLSIKIGNSTNDTGLPNTSGNTPPNQSDSSTPSTPAEPQTPANTPPPPGSCIPKTCAELNWECGTGIEPNCNKQINCGLCDPGYVCDNHKCVKNTTKYCKEIMKNGNYSNKIDFVILGYGYNDKSKFENDAEEFANFLFAHSPWKEHKNLFNVYSRLAESDLACYEIGHEEFICNAAKVQEEASKCAQYDRILVLWNKNKKSGAAAGVWTKIAYSTNYSNDKDWKLIAMHELSHTFGLLDEYSYDTDPRGSFNPCPGNENNITKCCQAWAFCNLPPYLSSLPSGWNCTTDSSCSAWSSLSGAECLKGCMLSNWYRSSGNSIMRTLQTTEYSPAAKAMLEKAFEYLTGG